MGRLFTEAAQGEKVLISRCCRHDAASYDDIESKEFQGRYGRAYLFKKVVNVTVGDSEERYLSSGLHIVNDIYCVQCGQLVGWKYETAMEESQKYKEGLFILEKERMEKANRALQQPVN